MEFNQELFNRFVKEFVDNDAGVIRNIYPDAIYNWFRSNLDKKHETVNSPVPTDNTSTVLEEIKTITEHNIPHYGYGDNEAACELADRLAKIYVICTEESTKELK